MISFTKLDSVHVRLRLFDHDFRLNSYSAKIIFKSRSIFRFRFFFPQKFARKNLIARAKFEHAVVRCVDPSEIPRIDSTVTL